MAPRILNLRTRSRGVLSFTPRGKSLRYPLNRSLGGTPSRSGRGGQEKKSCHYSCQELNPCHQARSLVLVLTVLLRLFDCIEEGN
jgi:hypothetical protein